MKAGIIFTGSGPILILSSYPDLDHPALVGKLAKKGILKFIAHELDPELVARRYGDLYQAVRQELRPLDDLRVLDYNGHNVFNNFSFQELGPPVMHE